jgi:2-keto-4-pentenoate hydratase/2-oxohepta-3-ene-1,7-dioic acid hydratase in catechol pathway
VSPSALGKDPHELRITTHVNGKRAQETSTANLLARVVSGLVLLACYGAQNAEIRESPLTTVRLQPELIARLSHGATLEPGSLILTGSPVAVGRKAPADASSESPFMQDGDEVRCFVEGCGESVFFRVVSA